MKKIIATLFFVFAVSTSCTDGDRSRRVLEDAGYTNISIEGYDAFACAKSDDTCTEFYADGPSGRRVHGAVGCELTGCGKACTIRIH